MRRGDGGVDEVASWRSEPSENAVLVGASEPAKADDVGDQNFGKFPTPAGGAENARAEPQTGRAEL